MKKTASFIICTFILSLSQLAAQEYTAAKYWSLEMDSAYVSLSERQKSGDTLSVQEQKILTDYNAMLSEYFNKLSDNEKSLYYKYRAKWVSKPASLEKSPYRQESDVFAGERSMYTQYLVANGIFGALYGGAAVAVFGLDEDGGGAAAGIPLLTAGASVLIPVLTIKDKNVSYNSLALSTHGKIAGALQGAAFGFLLAGGIENEVLDHLTRCKPDPSLVERFCNDRVCTLGGVLVGLLGDVPSHHKLQWIGRARTEKVNELFCFCECFGNEGLDVCNALCRAEHL